MKGMASMGARAPRRGKQQGFSALELLGVLIVGLVLLALAAVLVTTLFNRNAVNDVVRQTSSTVSDIRGYYSLQSSCAGLNNALATSANMLPDDMLVAAGGGGGGTNIVHALGGTVTVSCTTLNGVGNQGISLALDGIESGSTCTKLTSAFASIFDTLSVGGTAVKAFGADLDLAAAGPACSASNAVTITGVAQRV